MRTIHAICPRTLDDGTTCEAEQDVEVDTFYEGGWCAQFAVPTACPEGHDWTPDEIAAVTTQVTEWATEPTEPDDE